MGASSQQDPIFVVGDRDDHRSVCARVVLRAVLATDSDPTTLGRLGGTTTSRTKRMTVVPVRQGYRSGKHSGVDVAKILAGLAQRLPPLASGVKTLALLRRTQHSDVLTLVIAT